MASNPKELAERRGAERRSRRLSCEVWVSGRRHSAVVLDLSVGGLLLRTGTDPPPGTPLEVIVRRAGGEVWKITARVARNRRSDEDVPMISARGLGVEIVSAPKGFYEFLNSLDS